MVGYVLYNPLAGNGDAFEEAKILEVVKEEKLIFFDMTKIDNYVQLLSELAEEDYIIICGGDGTLNRFINDTAGLEIRNEIQYYAVGTGNDFAKDVGDETGNPIRINEYINNLPTVTVNGKTYRFLNGVGYGIDGYCCEVGDKLKSEGKKPNYTAIAIKGLLFGYKPTAAKVTVDGKKYTYNKVWIAPTMNGRYYGGGMMPTPNQKRFGDNKRVSLMVFHGSGKLRTLMIFPSIFKGEHIRHTKQVAILEGNEISVEFDSPKALQIDGETVLDVLSYTVAVPKRVTVKESNLSAVK